MLAAAAAASVAVALRVPVPPPSVRPVRIHLGSARAEHLLALPGIGPVLAARLAAARDEATIDSEAGLFRVEGVGPGIAAKVAPHLEFGRPARPP